MEHKEVTTIGNERFTVTMKIQDLGQKPYFSATIDIYDMKDRQMSGGRADHESIAKAFPHLAKYLKWHLVNVSTGPMHYVANSLYWAGFSGWCDGKPNSPPNAAHLRSTCVFGVTEHDTKAPESMDKEELTTWLHVRFEELMAAFDKDMNELFELQPA